MATVTVRGSGGSIFELDLPTRPDALLAFQRKIERGELVYVELVGDEWVDVDAPAPQVAGNTVAEVPAAGIDVTDTGDVTVAGNTTGDTADADAETPAGIPAGSMGDVLEWVGDDPARAAEALAAERERPNPRKKLVERLEGLAG